MARKDDEARVMEAFKRATLNYSEASRAVGTLSEVTDLLDDVRHTRKRLRTEGDER